MSEMVYVRATTGATKDVYHTSPDCSRLDRARNVLKKDLSVLPNDIRECAYCSGERNAPAQDHHAHYRSLLEAAEDD